ncbi:MAG TPA: hypothetical protein VE978_03260 [Chitinophagales bacterium]|nr:hypothetical protein [Chitinophagales bacterium]
MKLKTIIFGLLNMKAIKMLFDSSNVFRACFLLIIFSSSLSSCRKDYFIPPPVDLNTPVSFSQQVVPIFDNSCALSSCHLPGAQVPDLTAENAYDQLLLLGYVDSTNVDGSVLYKRLISTSDPMPPDEKLSPDQINLIYAWISQGALNN